MTPIYRLFLEYWHKIKMWGLHPLAPMYGESIIKLANIKEPYHGKRLKK